jgi:hypothetical protein
VEEDVASTQEPRLGLATCPLFELERCSDLREIVTPGAALGALVAFQQLEAHDSTRSRSAAARLIRRTSSMEVAETTVAANKAARSGAAREAVSRQRMSGQPHAMCSWCETSVDGFPR